MIIVSNVTLSFGTQDVFKNVSLTVNNGQRIGVVGRNGAGKSTFFKVLAGLQEIDNGSVSIQGGAKVAYLPQEIVMNSSKTVIAEALETFGPIYELEHECKTIEAELEGGQTSAAKVERYAELQNQLAELDVPSLQTKTKKVLTGLGFDQAKMQQSVNELSVGWKMRLILGKLLLSDADFYLFDEPTNHLDLVAKEWFSQFLKESTCGFLLISHDRYFLDHICDYTFELEGGNGRLFHGNYTELMEQKEAELEVLEQKHALQQKEIKRKMAIVEKFRAKASKAKTAQSMLKQIERIEKIELPKELKSVNFSFGYVERSGKVAVTVEDVGISFGPKKIVEHISFEIFRGEKVALVAANGTGKTTLFKGITGKVPLTHGQVTLGHNVKTALFEQDQDKVLSPNKTIIDEVEDACPTSETRSKARSLLGSFLFPGDDAYKKIKVLSGGEKNRVAMVKVLLQGANLLFLDEPTNHLDLVSKDILLNALLQYEGTLFFVSHDRDFVEKLATRIIELTPTRALNFPGNYESYLYHKKVAQAASDAAEFETQDEAHSAHEGGEGKAAYERGKRIRNLEAKIERLDKEKNEVSMQFGEFEYGTPEFDKIAKKVKEIERKRDEAFKEWEELEAKKG